MLIIIEIHFQGKIQKKSRIQARSRNPQLLQHIDHQVLEEPLQRENRLLESLIQALLIQLRPLHIRLHFRIRALETGDYHIQNNRNNLLKPRYHSRWQIKLHSIRKMNPKTL
jgi:hypothetical protein